MIIRPIPMNDTPPKKKRDILDQPGIYPVSADGEHEQSPLWPPQTYFTTGWNETELETSLRKFIPPSCNNTAWPIAE